ncbi:hypothetical protein PSC71_08375 [Devosia sp. J2-20]|uniref:phage tail terminator protein n=1 Tax=Devosia sp. J2-20 TaxID=3026161 RepID=UPI002499CED5|nr:hypothetical protein [Devosia sp. J2-20]WDR00749.1 hypothetical protein PSC71_08375 [Devosia sp. J2-20]
MSTIPELKARLGADGTPFTVVLGATSFAQVKDRPAATLPVAYVFVSEEESADNERMTGPVLQRAERDVTVVYVLEHLGDADGGDVADPLEVIKAYGRGRLIGFVPTDMADPITHLRGAVLEAADGVVWWADTFSAPIYLMEIA